MEKTTPGKERTKFRDAPISELVVVMYHLPIVELHSQHIGLYWSRIREDYPECEQQNVVSQNLQSEQFLVENPNEVFPLPRYWFYNESGPTLIQLQRNAFFLNWRRRDEHLYPHYESVIANYWEEVDRYQKFLREALGIEIPALQRCELTYVNFIEPNALYSSTSQLGTVLPPLAGLHTLERADRELGRVHSTATYRVTPTLLVEAVAQAGLRQDTKQPIITLEVKAHGTPEDLSLASARDWYDKAHDATYSLFLDFTSQQIQENVWHPL